MDSSSFGTFPAKKGAKRRNSRSSTESIPCSRIRLRKRGRNMSPNLTVSRSCKPKKKRHRYCMYCSVMAPLDDKAPSSQRKLGFKLFPAFWERRKKKEEFTVCLCCFCFALGRNDVAPFTWYRPPAS